MAKKKSQTDKMQVDEPVSDQSTNIIDVVWNFFSSMKLGIFLLIIVAIMATIGTIFTPKDPVTGQQQFEKYYAAWYFVIPLGLLLLNLLVCSVNRWKQITSTIKGPNLNVSEQFVKNLAISGTSRQKSSVGEALDKVKKVFQKHGYRVVTGEKDNVALVAADKGRYGILGPYITHIGFIVIIIALILKFSGLVGFDGGIYIGEKETKSIADIEGIQHYDVSNPYTITLNSFRTEFDPDGQSVSNWYSDVTVKDGNNKFDYSIYVNNPLIYKNIKFYQSSYGKYFKITGTLPNSKPDEASIYQDPNNQQYKSFGNISIRPINYDPVSRKSTVEVYNGSQLAETKTLAANETATFQDLQYQVFGGNYTYLSAKYDPTVIYMLIGTIILMVGIIWSFVIRQKRIWARISDSNGNAVINFGGLSVKSKQAFEQEFEQISQELK